MDSTSQPPPEPATSPLALEFMGAAPEVDTEHCQQTGPPSIADDQEWLVDSGSTTVQSTIEPDSSIDDEGYAATVSTSYVTSIASDIRRGIEENGRIYAAYGIHKPWMPVDDMEVCIMTRIMVKSCDGVAFRAGPDTQ